MLAGIGIESWKDRIAAAETSYDLLRIFREVARSQDFEYFCISRLPQGRPARLAEHTLLSNLPSEIIRHSDETGWNGEDELIVRAANSIDWWVRCSSDSLPSGTLGIHPLFADLAMLGVEATACFPVQSVNSVKGVAMLGKLSGTMPDETVMLMLHHACRLAFDRLSRMAAGKQQKSVMLSDRQRECLYWTSMGKTSLEIASITGLSVHTVDHYISEAGQKLDTVNRTHTIAMALRRGMID